MTVENGSVDDVILTGATTLKFLYGDAGERLKEISSESINLIVTSPPYDSIRSYENSLNWNFTIFKKISIELSRVLSEGGIIVWIVGDETKDFCESLSSFKQSIYFVEECGLNLLDTMIYAKNGGPSPYPDLKRYSSWFEYMFVFSKGKPKIFNPIKDVLTKSGEGKINKGSTARQKNGDLKDTGSYLTEQYKIRSNIWTYDVGKNKDTKDDIALIHPARFPEKLAYDHIITWSNKGDTVLDPFMGSGTTAKQAKILDRNYIGIEIVESYFKISVERIKYARKKLFDI